MMTKAETGGTQLATKAGKWQEGLGGMTWILDFQLSELKDNKIIVFSHPVCGTLLQKPGKLI